MRAVPRFGVALFRFINGTTPCDEGKLRNTPTY